MSYFIKSGNCKFIENREGIIEEYERYYRRWN